MNKINIDETNMSMNCAEGRQNGTLKENLKKLKIFV